MNPDIWYPEQNLLKKHCFGLIDILGNKKEKKLIWHVRTKLGIHRKFCSLDDSDF